MASKKQKYTLSWDAEEPKAIVMLIHGVAEHCARYERLGSHLAKHGYSTMAFDLPGHGRSPGTPGHIDRFSNYIDAALSFYKSVKSKYPDLPIFLLGHSMGGLISTQLLLDHQKLFKGAILSGPAIEVPDKPPSWQVAIIKMLAAIAPKLKLLQIEATGISRDSQVIKAYLRDPLVYKGKLSARFLLELSNAMNDCKARTNRIKLPLLILHGGDDPITKPSGSQFLYDHVNCKDKKLRIYPGLCHEIFNEPEADAVYADIVTWLESKIKTR